MTYDPNATRATASCVGCGVMIIPGAMSEEDTPAGTVCGNCREAAGMDAQTEWIAALLARPAATTNVTVRLLLEATPELMPALDVIFAKTGASFEWDEGPDRLRLDGKPSYDLPIGTMFRLIVGLDTLEELAGWAEGMGKDEAAQLAALYQRAEAEVYAQGA